MKNVFKTIVVISFFFFAPNAVAQQKTVQKAIIKTAIACDHCKECETCGQLLQKNLLATKGVQMFTLKEKEQTLEVIYNSKKVDLKTIKTVISKSGYDADEVKADPAG